MSDVRGPPLPPIRPQSARSVSSQAGAHPIDSLPDKAYYIITRLRIIFFYFYLNIPIPYARKIFKIFPYFSKIFPYFFTLTKQLF